MSIWKTVSTCAATALVVVACQTTSPTAATPAAAATPTTTTAAPAPPAAPAAPKAAIGEHGFALTDLDRSANACDDFYQFATGGWKAANPVPPAYSRWGRFDELANRNRETLKAILEQASTASNAPGTNAQRIGDFYATCMAEPAIEAAGYDPLKPELQKISAIANTSSLLDEIARLQRDGIDAAFGFGSQQDFKNSTEQIAVAVQGGLGLPDKDYYLRTDEKSKQIRDEYVKYLTSLFQLTGDSADVAARDARNVLAFETKLAQASMSRVDQRDPEKVYHIMTVPKADALTPNLPWNRYFELVGVHGVDTLNVAMPDFFKALDRELTSTPLSTWKSYLKARLVDSYSPMLSQPFVDAQFNFHSRVLRGTKENLPRWQRCVRSVDADLGMALGEEYVKRAFTPEAKAHALDMINNLIAALRADIPTLQWMGADTQKAALTKLDAFKKKIGYPDKWRDYSALTIDRSSWASNAMRANEFEFNRDVAKIGKPVDPTEWWFTPPTVNASYNPSKNDISFPAGILQPPFYDPNADDAYNYGGAGMVIGHEMTHGFDDEGSQFDALGNLRNWWSEADLKNFKERADCVRREFDSFEVEPGLHENGKLVNGEAIADLGGVKLAYAAYEKSLEGKPREVIDGFTPEQRFFLGVAQVWAQNIRPEEAHLRVATDPHPLAQFRVNGTLMNLPEFAKAFNCPIGAKMVRADNERCGIW